MIRWRRSPQKICKQIPGICDCSSYLEKGSLWMWLRILKWRHNHGLSGWALNTVTNVLIIGRGRLEIERRGAEGSMKTKAETGVMQPNAKEDPRILHQPEAGRGQDWILLYPRRECEALTDLGHLAWRIVRINFCWLKPLRLW